MELVRREHEKATKILTDNIGKLHEIAKYLYEHETITGEEFMKILEEKRKRAMRTQRRNQWFVIYSDYS